MKTFFPNQRVVCSTHCENITEQNVKDLIEACDSNDIKICLSTRNLMKDPYYPYYLWDSTSLTQTKAEPEEEPSSSIVVPFNVFLKIAKGEIIIRENTIVDTSGSMGMGISNSKPKSKPKFLY